MFVNVGMVETWSTNFVQRSKHKHHRKTTKAKVNELEGLKKDLLCLFGKEELTGPSVTANCLLTGSFLAKPHASRLQEYPKLDRS